MTAVLALFRLGRPLLVGSGLILYALGAVVAALHGHELDARRYALGQGAVTAFQLMAHYASGYFDEGAAHELPRRVALIAAVVLALVGGALAMVIGSEAGANAGVTLVAMFVLAWAYSAPPLRLCARGLGELAAAIAVAGLVPWLAFAVQAADLRGLDTLVLAIVPLVLLQLAMLFAVELAEVAGDAAAGKRTLIVRLGTERGAQLFALITTLAYAWLPVASLLGLPTRVVLAATAPVPIAVWRISRVADGKDPNALDQLTFFAVFVVVATSLAEVVALVTLL